jgi:hypothetical protein
VRLAAADFSLAVAGEKERRILVEGDLKLHVFGEVDLFEDLLVDYRVSHLSEVCLVEIHVHSRHQTPSQMTE